MQIDELHFEKIWNNQKNRNYEKGVVLETGTHSELITKEEGLYHKLSKMQFELT